MTVWVEEPHDGGSAVWTCSACSKGGWCSDHTSAFIEARLHAHGHDQKVSILGQTRGPRTDRERDQRIRDLRAEGNSLSSIATAVGITASGVSRALHRMERA
jgi:DNA invertase Pin-like site-specific DNA recombinase